MTHTDKTTGGRLRRVAHFGKWGTATAVVITEAAQRYVYAGETGTAADLIDHLHTGAYWSLGLQLLTMTAEKVWQMGSVTVTWGKGHAGPAAPPGGQALATRTEATVPENGGHASL